MEIILIAAISQNFGLGLNNQLLFDSKEDMQHFKETTTGSPIIMGRKTYDSMGGFLLPHRYNIIISNQDKSSFSPKIRKSEKNRNVEECFDVMTFDELLSEIKLHQEITTNLFEKVYVIGGGEIYKLFLPLATKIILTKFKEPKASDTFFPNFDNMEFHSSEVKQITDATIVTYTKYQV